MRKVLPDGGAAICACRASLMADLDPDQAWRLVSRLVALQTQTRQLVAATAIDNTLAYWVADDYLRVAGAGAAGLGWLQIEQAAPTASTRWSVPAQALRWVMPELAMRLAIIDAAIACVPATGCSALIFTSRPCTPPAQAPPPALTTSIPTIWKAWSATTPGGCTGSH